MILCFVDLCHFSMWACTLASFSVFGNDPFSKLRFVILWKTPVKLASHWAISSQHRANCGQPPQLPAIWLLTWCSPVGWRAVRHLRSQHKFCKQQRWPPLMQIHVLQTLLIYLYRSLFLHLLLERVRAFTMLWDYTNELFTKTTLKKSKRELVKRELLYMNSQNSPLLA